ncbi:MAG: Trk system potassium transporter TrkA [Oscillospiraceae bacterium]|nr:Trk system potassium transporter TrkA [Oscillospiraceae bacterium]
MKIVIAGAGKVGRTIATALTAEKHDITVIDSDPETIEEISGELDVICVEGNAADPETLREARTGEAELLIATTEKDEVNMVCGMASHHLGVEHVIARIRDPQYLHQTDFLREAMGLTSIVNPEYECAKEVSRILRFPGAARVDSFSKGSVEIAEYRVPAESVLNGLALKELAGRFRAKVLIGLVEREDTALIPNGNTVLWEGDRLSITGASGELRRFFAAIGAYRKPVRHAMVMGGGRTAVYLYRLLHDSNISVTVLERDRELCERLCDAMPDAEIVCGDATSSEILGEYGIESTDAFVALTGDDGDNIVTSLYAKECQVGKVVIKVNRDHFADILIGAGLESIVSPKEIVAEQITRYVRGLSDSAGSSMEMLYRLADGKIEALEFRADENLRCTNRPLKELKLKKNTLLTAIIRGSKSILPDGESRILPGDHAVVVAESGTVGTLDDILE